MVEAFIGNEIVWDKHRNIPIIPTGGPYFMFSPFGVKLPRLCTRLLRPASSSAPLIDEWS